MQILRPRHRPARRRLAFFLPQWMPPDAITDQGTPYRALPIAGSLLHAGYELLWWDQDHPSMGDLERLQHELEGVEDLILWMNELDPLIQTNNCMQMVRTAREHQPGIRVTVGGSFINVLPPRYYHEALGIDFVLQGCGEVSVPMLMDALAEQGDLSSIPGLVWKEGRYRHNPYPRSAAICKEHYEIYDQIDLEPYLQRGGMFGNDQDTFVFAGTQGCGKGCDFCYWSNFSLGMLPVEDTIEILSRIQKRLGVKQFHLAELDIAASPGRLRKFARSWTEHMPDCRWFGLASPVDLARLEGADWNLLAEGGCRKLEVGTESGSQRILTRIGKRHHKDDPISITRHAIARGIQTMHNFVFGIPGETKADRAASLDLIRRLRDLDPQWTLFTFRFFQPTPGTRLGDEAISHYPDPPVGLKAFLASRQEYGAEWSRSMPWLEPAAERQVKLLAYHYLPLMTSKLVYPKRTQQFLYRGFRRLARIRLRTRFYALQLDMRLFRSTLGGCLDNTYIP